MKAITRFLNERETIIAEALKKDLGRCKFEAVGLEIIGTLSEIDYIIDNLHSWMQPTYTKVPAMMAPAQSEIMHDPYGVCLIMGAFNYPISLTVRKY